ncbi:MAG: DegT/DnrJ/EryC1/StrS family aminotransferase, partial [Ekhidna sp.]|nr:DegT/DnrJ/EryC1/StrS family aminotransferase [Ekhidna sp.]
MTHSPIFLSDNTITKNELELLSEWMLEGNRLTKSVETSRFEKQFSDWIGSKYSLFVNSGSSANLLMIYAFRELGRLRNNRAIAPAVSWVTTVSPLLQFSFDTILCDCDSENLGLDLNHLEALIKKHDPALLILVHVLGHSNSMDEIKELCDRHEIILLEDTCEALGSSYNQINLGTIGNAGSFSFYYGHHISTIEGGMVVTDDYELYQTMLSLRSHGWSRDLDPAIRKQLTDINQIDEFQNLYTFYSDSRQFFPLAIYTSFK